jgi:8-oxo-dGTP pyrophosphatase MutT (NUDIX family)
VNKPVYFKRAGLIRQQLLSNDSGVHRLSLISSLKSYSTPFPEESRFIQPFLQLLEHPRCYHRDHLPGHVTGSAWIVTPDYQKVLLVHHAKLNKWLQPGGHADGDENILHVALREAEEETGLKIKNPPSSFFDIDIHSIPARKETREHDHYDIRFMFLANESDSLRISDESNDLKWVGLNDLEKYNDSPSLLRMRQKLLGRHQ